LFKIYKFSSGRKNKDDKARQFSHLIIVFAALKTANHP